MEQDELRVVVELLDLDRRQDEQRIVIGCCIATRQLVSKWVWLEKGKWLQLMCECGSGQAERERTGWQYYDILAAAQRLVVLEHLGPSVVVYVPLILQCWKNISGRKGFTSAHQHVFLFLYL